MKIEGVEVSAVGFEPDKTELLNYVRYVRSKVTKPVTDVEVILCDDGMIDINYRTIQKFERIRRITGYLVGTMDKWNDSKKAEERERVKHDAK